MYSNKANIAVVTFKLFEHCSNIVALKIVVANDWGSIKLGWNIDQITKTNNKYTLFDGLATSKMPALFFC